MSLHNIYQPPDRGTWGWSKAYDISYYISEDIMMREALWLVRYHSTRLGVPVAGFHAYWGGDYADPLSTMLVIGYRDDWGMNCPKRCKLHA